MATTHARRCRSKAGSSRCTPTGSATSDSRDSPEGQGARPKAHDGRMIVLSGADVVLPDRILSPGTLVVDAGRIVDIRPGAVGSGFGRSSITAAAASPFAFHGHSIVPGF